MRNPPDAQVAGALEDARWLFRLIQWLGWLGVNSNPNPAARERMATKLWTAPQSLTANERNYLTVLLGKNFPATRSKKGRPLTPPQRDFVIAEVVNALVKWHGIPATRNREQHSSRPSTACGIAAKVLGECGVNFAEASIEGIWAQRPAHTGAWEFPKDVRLSPKDKARLSLEDRFARLI